MKSISGKIPRSSLLQALPARPDDAAPLRRLGNLHWGPLVATALLSAIGLATVNSASAELTGDFFARQLLWLAVGTIALVVVAAIDYHKLVELAPAFYGFGLILLVLVLTVGREVRGARSWLGLGPIGGQPSELAKIATVVLLARYLARVQRPYLGMREIVVAVALVAVPMALIGLQNDLGSAAMYCPMLAGMLLVTGVRWQHLLAGCLLAIVLAFGVWEFAMQPAQQERVLSYISPDSDPLDSGYQARQSKIAVGSGQWLGRGYGQGTQSQLRFLPDRHTDFILAVLAEEWGFVGVLAVLALYSLFITSAAAIALRSRDRAGVLVIVGLLSVFTFHVLYNSAMVVGLLPITGIPLPFLSYGGSFTLVNFLATGLILNVDYRRYVNR